MSLTLCLYVEPEGDAAVEDNEEPEDTEEQDEEKMKTSDEVEYVLVMTVLLLYIICVLLKQFKHQLTSCQSPTGHSWTRSNVVWGNVIPGQLHPAQQIHLFWQCQKYFHKLNPNSDKIDVTTHTQQINKSITLSVSYAILHLSLFFLHRERQELRHLIFCGDQRGGNDFQDCCWICRVSFKSAADVVMLQNVTTCVKWA